MGLWRKEKGSGRDEVTGNENFLQPLSFLSPPFSEYKET
jgi:hypothetical protein